MLYSVSSIDAEQIWDQQQRIVKNKKSGISAGLLIHFAKKVKQQRGLWNTT